MLFFVADYFALYSEYLTGKLLKALEASEYEDK
jgi:hypothetical protein